tara:strand:+ start:6881 stop:7870 length:990 start_codon:yes stop_codon:yes gene_type:complete
MKYSEIYGALNDLASEEDGDDFETMAKLSIQLHYRELLSESNTDLERREYTFTTVSGIGKYGMPLYVADVLNIEDSRNDRPLELYGPTRFDREHSGSTQTAEDPQEASYHGEYGVQKQPVTAGAITVESSSVLDTGSDYQIIVHGMVGGVDTREIIDFSGTTASSSTNSFDAESNAIGIRRLTLKQTNSVVFVGFVTVKDVDGNTLAVIPPYWGDSPSYQWWEFWPVPSAATTYIVRCLAHKPPMINDDDIPELPLDFHDLLIYGPQSILLAGKGKESSAAAAGRKYMERKKAFLGRRQHKGIKSRGFINASNRYIQRGNLRKIPNAVE